MQLIFVNDDLRELCNTRARLRDRFGNAGAVIERRLLVLANARVLGEVTMRPPDRRRREPRFGPAAASVCARAAGRIYFRALGIEGRSGDKWDEVEEIEIFAIEGADP